MAIPLICACGSKDGEKQTPDRLPPLPPAECNLPAIEEHDTVYYACDCAKGAADGCSPGDDSADGTSPERAFRTYDRARRSFADLQPGNAVAFCRGGAFDIEGGGTWENSRCLADWPCFVRDYDPGTGTNLPAPLIRGDERGAFQFADGGDANHEEGYTLANLDLRGEGQSDRGLYFYNDIDDVRICGLRIDGFRLGVHVGGSNAPESDSDGLNERIVLLDSRITNNSGQGWLGSCNGCAIERCVFDNNGFGEATFNHNLYLGGADQADGMRVVDNELRRSTIVNGECRGVSLVVHGNRDGLLIEGNRIEEELGAVGRGCWGIAVDTGYPQAERFENIIIRRNTVVNVGNLGIGVNACQDCLIENNVIIHGQESGTRAIAAPTQDRQEDDATMERVVVRNNTVVIGSTGTAITVAGEGRGHVVVSNAIVFTNDDGDAACFRTNLSEDSYRAIDHNLCSYSEGRWTRDHNTLAQWQEESGFDEHSLDIPPEFTSVEGAKLDLAAASNESPLVDNGHPELSSEQDFTGAPRTGSPDIGAYER
ncbi:MAG: right-handed parallel beta-helix repeat-containing protein [Myxococcales bacterium]|nr:right-handed parallel beta-helix repeat-containing protein [Myxococcales bacterium]